MGGYLSSIGDWFGTGSSAAGPAMDVGTSSTYDIGDFGGLLGGSNVGGFAGGVYDIGDSAYSPYDVGTSSSYDIGFGDLAAGMDVGSYGHGPFDFFTGGGLLGGMNGGQGMSSKDYYTLAKIGMGMLDGSKQSPVGGAGAGGRQAPTGSPFRGNMSAPQSGDMAALLDQARNNAAGGDYPKIDSARFSPGGNVNLGAGVPTSNPDTQRIASLLQGMSQDQISSLLGGSSSSLLGR